MVGLLQYVMYIYPGVKITVISVLSFGLCKIWVQRDEN